ncbi:MAG: hypothetical protein OHK93_000081 [Ramalina farinacea]|uniref:Uncharacterized protein n=1 Tax=Ramalina farinacea TaxID=258253 RepID=A0AA43QE61_9LECA|nr:hypothetical protein [Ramalina farinacea]
MADPIHPSKVLLVGSSPLESASNFFSTAIAALPSRLQQIPDGEVGFRNNFIAWQHPVFPITIVQPRWGGQPSAESSAKQYTLADINPTGYDEQARISYATFREFKESKRIPADVRFQVCLPSPLTVVRGFVEDDGVCAQVDPLYEERLLQALKNIQDTIPASELAIQWDLPTEIACLEYDRGGLQDQYWKPYFSPVKAGIFDRLIRLASAVKPDVRMGFHLCYGDMGHVHFLQPANTELLVEVANDLVQKISPLHHIGYIHMPVPKDRIDATYYKPMAALKLNDTELFLGLVHANDEIGTRQRLEAAQAVYPDIAGVATECGMGRTPLEDINNILEICAAMTA